VSGGETPAQIRAKYRSAFEQFYRVYPRRVAPTEAERVFADLCARGTDPAYLIARAKAYAETVDPKDMRYVPAPHSWLKQGRYEDEDLFTNQREQELVWLRECWRKADVKAVESRFFVTFPKQYPPEEITDPDAIRLWYKAAAQAWITQVVREKLAGIGGGSDEG
jgi:hypothetical protein